MSAGNGNPFLAGKLEYETDPVIYVTGGQEGFFDWISEQQYLFEGLRGSGKSSILRSMEWDVAWHVTDMTKVEGPPLVKQFLKKPPTYLGVRCSFEDMDIMYWDRWQAQVGRDWAQKYFGTYLEYTLLYLFLNALVGIIQKKPDLFTDPNFEKHLIEELLPIGFPNAKCRPRLPEQSLWSLRNLFRDQHFTMRDLVYRKSPLKVLSDTLPVLSPGNLIQQFGYSIKSAGFSHWKIFPLLDDCNHLTEWQVEVINSAISRAKNPVAYKVTSVSGLYKSRKTIDDRPLNEQELKTMKISGASEASWELSRKFEQVVQGVCQTRIAKHYGDDLARNFDFKAILGNFDLEELLAKTIKDSEKKDAIELLLLAEKEAKSKNKAKVSITSTWLDKHQIREKEIPSHSDATVQKRLIRRLKSMYTKKWNHSAAVAICLDPHLKLSFPYYGWRTILHLSSGSIREMLRIMSEIWDEVHLPIDGFIGLRGIHYRKQKAAIKRASDKLFEGIDEKPLFRVEAEKESSIEQGSKHDRTTSLRSICNRFGRLFVQLQSYPAICITPESASLKITKADLPPDIREAINFAVMTGVMLKIEDESMLTVGLHPILAPLFNISFRSPFYYPVTVSTIDFVTLIQGSNYAADATINKILGDRLAHIAKFEGPAQTLLPI